MSAKSSTSPKKTTAATSIPPEPTPECVKLLSADGFEFVVDRKCAMASGTLRNLLSSPGQFTESIDNQIQFQDIKAVVLEKVCQYLYYKVRYGNATDVPEFPLEPEIALELLMAADFLDC